MGLSFYVGPEIEYFLFRDAKTAFTELNGIALPATNGLEEKTTAEKAPTEKADGESARAEANALVAYIAARTPPHLRSRFLSLPHIMNLA